MARSWRCLETGCDAVIVAADDEVLVVAVNRHMDEAHHSLELEEVILDAAEETSEP